MPTLRSVAVSLCLCCGVTLDAGDWPQFRGPYGSGVADVSQPLPTNWSSSANLAWKTSMPGPGVSSPIVVNGKVFVTCYSGYGLSRENPGEMKDLMRHLVCVDLQTGEVDWQQDVAATLPEDPFSGPGVPAHGYASHTSVSDGENVYAFFGKGGVHAFDMDGNHLWQADVGQESDPAKWGSSSSPILHEDTVIITAAAESQSIVGLDKATGNELWSQPASRLDNVWGTPSLVVIDENRTDLVMCIPGEIWGLDPNSGKLRWYAETAEAEQVDTSQIVIAQEEPEEPDDEQDSRRRSGGRRRTDPMDLFTRRDTNNDGELTEDELSSSVISQRIAELDKDGDKVVTKNEFRAGAATISRSRSGASRPQRPERPELAE